MFFRKVTSKSNGKEYTYVKLIENYREGNKVKQRVVANLGNIEDLTPEKVQSLITGLNRICGFSQDIAQEIESKKVLEFGEVIAINKVWDFLGVSKAISQSMQDGDNQDIPLLVELMVMNQIIKPRNSKAVSDWYRCLYLPHLEGKRLTVDQFNEALDLLVSNKDMLENHLYEAINKVLPLNTETVYCNLTRAYFEKTDSDSESILETPDRKLVEAGILLTRDGIPIGGHIYPVSLNEEDGFKEKMEGIKETYRTKNIIFVGKQAIIGEENIQLLTAYGHQYIIGLELRFNREVERIQGEMRAPGETFTHLSDNMAYKDINIRNTRYIICIDTQKADAKKKWIDNRLSSIEKELLQIKKWVSEKFGTNARANFYKASGILKNTYCKRYFDCWYDEKNFQFDYEQKSDIIERDKSYAGKFILKTNNMELTSQEIIKSYLNYRKARNEIKLIKNYEPFPEESWEKRIKGHVFIFMLAYLVEKTLERILVSNGMSISASKALAMLEDIKVTVNQLNNSEIKSVTPAYEPQQKILKALGIKQLQRMLDGY
ncbi:mobile element protein [Desulfocucumis palustris]|uniref:Mobile element protein n=1 Tax=Desulfocucumis palustris TaxID=1898651 RepID=A0A2L2XE21_9FIRM|nr:IS1634 family transposase [Desulfocucumis palustris]GBF34488.1 mobile element protein [Desulfocucumis palustris]